MKEELNAMQQTELVVNDLVAPAWAIKEYPQFSPRTIYRHLEVCRVYRIAGSKQLFYSRSEVKKHLDAQRAKVYENAL